MCKLAILIIFKQPPNLIYYFPLIELWPFLHPLFIGPNIGNHHWSHLLMDFGIYLGEILDEMLYHRRFDHVYFNFGYPIARPLLRQSMSFLIDWVMEIISDTKSIIILYHILSCIDCIGRRTHWMLLDNALLISTIHGLYYHLLIITHVHVAIIWSFSIIMKKISL